MTFNNMMLNPSLTTGCWLEHVGEGEWRIPIPRRLRMGDSISLVHHPIRIKLHMNDLS